MPLLLNFSILKKYGCSDSSNELFALQIYENKSHETDLERNPNVMKGNADGGEDLQ